MHFCKHVVTFLVVATFAALTGWSAAQACDRGGGQFQWQMAAGKSADGMGFNKPMNGGPAKNLRGNFSKQPMGGGFSAFGKQPKGSIRLGKPAGGFGGAGKQVGGGFSKTFGKDAGGSFK